MNLDRRNLRTMTSGLTLALLCLGACSDDDQNTRPYMPPVTTCTGDADCANPGEVCLEGVCRDPNAPGVDMGDGACGIGRAECFGRCCNEGYVCGSAGACECSTGALCNGACCAAGETCESGQCVSPCSGIRCGSELELCCEGTDVCLAGACTTPGASCRFNEECDAGQVCEPLLGKCVDDPGVTCEYRPPVGQFSPEIECEWLAAELDVEPTHNDVVAAPIVMDLVDEGEAAGDETPEIAFISFNRVEQGCCNAPSEIRIISGECGPGKKARTIATLSEVPVSNDIALAAGDINGDGNPEIVGIINIPEILENGSQRLDSNGNPVFRSHGTVAYTWADDRGESWKVLWKNEAYPAFRTHVWGGAPTISLANLDGKGAAEVVIGSVVLDGKDGKLIWDGVADRAEGAELDGQGHNVFGPVSSVVDVDDDGNAEVFAGNTLYSHDGRILWQHTYDTEASPCSLDDNMNIPLACDGYNGVVDFDGDMVPELVSIRRGEIWVLHSTDGSLDWKATIPKDDCERNESGPPTIADFDGDGRPEIGTAGADFYVVADQDCDTDDWESKGCYARNILWATPNEDCSSRSTASSVFDFEADGAAEVVYADETTFRIFSGSTGAVLFESSDHQSNTRMELPVIADVDNDNNAEVIIASAWGRDNSGKSGLRIWGDTDDNWVRTRRVWNQHAYHVTNIDEDGTIPTREPSNWKIEGLNNYRQNVQPSGVFDAPDLLVRQIRTGESLCSTSGVIEIYAIISNDGALGVPAGVSVKFEAVQGATVEEIITLSTEARLLPGQSTTLSTTWTKSASFTDAPFDIRVTVDDDRKHNECREANNINQANMILCNLEG